MFWKTASYVAMGFLVAAVGLTVAGYASGASSLNHPGILDAMQYLVFVIIGLAALIIFGYGLHVLAEWIEWGPEPWNSIVHFGWFAAWFLAGMIGFLQFDTDILGILTYLLALLIGVFPTIIRMWRDFLFAKSRG